MGRETSAAVSLPPGKLWTEKGSRTSRRPTPRCPLFPLDTALTLSSRSAVGGPARKRADWHDAVTTTAEAAVEPVLRGPRGGPAAC